jgi:hypothetical protein
MREYARPMQRALGIVVFTILAGCGGSDAPGPNDSGIVGDGSLGSCVALGPIGTPRPNCPSGLPPDDDCASASPVYDDVAPIFAARCSVCHQTGGLETKYIFDTYAQVHDNITVFRDILTQIFSCRMPPSCAPNLSSDERETMLKWLVCGGPQSRDAGTE